MVESFQRLQAPRRNRIAGSMREFKMVLRIRVMSAGLAVVPSRDYISPAGLVVTTLWLVQVFFVPAVPVRQSGKTTNIRRFAMVQSASSGLITDVATHSELLV
jgi:hypothetical protein